MKPDTPLDVLQHEIAAEKATAFGRAGRRLEAALAALTVAAPDEREQRLAEASEALFAYVVQREALGLRDSRRFLQDYNVPVAVIARMGARPKPR